MRKDLKRILQKAVYACLLLCVSIYSVAQTGVPQDENLVVAGSYVSPAPVVTGTPMQMCFIFEATNGATLKEAQGEEIRFTVGFNRVDFATLGNATVTTEYNAEGTQDFIEWTYYPVPREWRGIIKKSLTTFSGARICISNIIAGTATRQQADEFDGIGFLVDMTPHHRDPSSTDTDDDEERYTYSVVPANLAISKVVNNATPTVGQNVTFTVTATNNGPSNATGVVVNEPLPSGYTLVSATPSTGTYTAPNWTIGSLANGASATMTVTATVNATGSYANTVTVTGNEPDPDPTDNTDTETPTPTGSTNLAITKVVNNATPTVGQNVTFTITATNNGPSNATGVVVNEPLPSGYTLVSTTPSTGTYTAPNWTIGNLANGASATLTVTATVNATGSYANTVTIDGTEPDPDPTDNTDTETPTPTGSANLAVTKVVNNATPTVGQNVTFTITATNNGPSNATGVVVNEPLPSGYTLVSTTPSTGTYTAPNWTIGNLANGASATMTVVATVNATGTYANTVTIDGTEPDPDPTDNTDTETPTPTPAPAPAIALVKTGILSTDGNTITYTFTVRNTGNVILNPVVVNDPKLTPSNVTLLATSLVPGAETTGTATYTVTAAEKAAGQVQNTATATGTPPTGNPVTDVSGTEFTNNTPTVVPVPTADLSVTKTASNLTPAIGSQVTFTITATNNGPSNATGVVVNEPLPSGYTLVSTTPSTGTYTAPNWTIGNLANGASATMTVVATVNATGSYANTVMNQIRIQRITRIRKHQRQPRLQHRP